MEKVYYNYLNLQEFIDILPCSGLYLFGLVREALMYLSFAVNIEEMSKRDFPKNQILELKLPIVENHPEIND